MGFLETLEQLGFSTWVRESGSIWGFYGILWLHTVGMGVIAGITGLISLRLLGISPKIPIKPLESLYPILWAGFWLNLVTGTMLLIADATTKLRNYDFYVKMLLIFVGVWVLNRTRKKVFGDPELDRRPVSRDAKVLASLSLVCWLGAIIAGR